ncbi:maestro heat-like repeat-containing protein family member 2B [Struthio camelus]|uniref:maestro heat-like repeat-containing protein family member 2B n=1 Tax=Struthio camelus TaxID=8801 RepID=UPI003603FD27
MPTPQALLLRLLDSELKLALIQSVTEVSSAIQGVSNEENFHFSSKRVLLELLLDLVKQEPVGSVPSPVCCKAILALEHLSKIKPSLTQEENCHLLHACFQSLFPLPPLERTREEGEAAKDTQHGESLYRQSLGALGQLVASLEEGLTSSWLKETFHLLEAWLHSEKEWERERALQVCTQLTKAYAERSVDAGESTCAQLGSLIAVLGPLSCDSLVTSRQWAVDCVSCLLSTQGEAMHMKKEEVKHFREELSATDVDSLLKTSSQIAKVVCQAFPSEQVRDFLKAVLGSMLSFSPTCARAAGHWMLIFLEQRGREILPEVPEVLSVIYDHLPACQQDYLKEFLLHAVSVLACYHPEAVTNSLLQRRLPMDRLESAEATTTCAEHAVTNNEAALEPLTVTCAIFELVSALQTWETASLFLPWLFLLLLKQISDTLGKQMPSSPGRVPEEPVFVARAEDSCPCR